VIAGSAGPTQPGPPAIDKRKAAKRTSRRREEWARERDETKRDEAKRIEDVLDQETPTA